MPSILPPCRAPVARKSFQPLESKPCASGRGGVNYAAPDGPGRAKFLAPAPGRWPVGRLQVRIDAGLRDVPARDVRVRGRVGPALAGELRAAAVRWEETLREAPPS